MITFRQLRYLGALARQRHFGRAAIECGVSQPALSMQIRELERELRVELVERRPGDVTLTAAGVEIVERAEGIVSASRDLVDFAHHHGRLLTGTLRLGVIPTLAPYVLPKALPRLQSRHPELHLDLRETQTSVLLDELHRGDVDVALLALPVPEDEFEIAPLFEDAFLLAVPATDPIPRSTRVNAAQIDRQRLILLEEGHCLRDQALAYCSAERRNTNIGLGATSLATVMQMVANGYGITLVPRVAVDAEVRDARVKLLRFAAPEPGRTVGLVWRRTSPRQADFAALGTLIVEALDVEPWKPAQPRVPARA
jgi:LysR family hydrogen peroxide-inducible transcriptional activator